MKQKTTVKQRRSRLNRSRVISGLFFVIPAAVICTLFVIYPLIKVIYYSFTDWNGVSSTINFVGLENYKSLPHMNGFTDMIWATVSFAAGVTVLTILISFFVALALDKKSKGRLPRGMMRAMWFFPALLSGAIVGILWRIMYNYNNGFINAILVSVGLHRVNWLETVGVTNFAIIIGATWINLGMCIVIFLAGLQSIPTDLYEAAAIDGATSRQQLHHITLPMMASSITINVITTTIAAFKAYELPYLISQGQPGHSTLLITRQIYFYGFSASDFGRGSALSVVLLIVIMLISLVQLVYLRKRENIY